MRATRREVLAGVMAGAGELLFSGRLSWGQASAEAGLLNVTLTARSAGILRIGISPANDAPHPEELGVLGTGWAAPLLATSRAKQQTIAWGKYTIRIGTDPFSVTVLEGGRKRQQIRFETDSTDVSFDLNGPVFGLGEGAHPFDRRGTQDRMLNGQNGMDLRTFGARLPIPWVISPEGWGVFVGRPAGDFAFTQTEARFRDEEATSTRNVFLLIGDTPADVLREYATLTGFPQLPPLWAFGYQQSHRTIESAEQVLEEAKTFREKKLPVDAFIFLGTGFTPSGWNSGHGSFTFNERVFPDPPAQIKALHEEHLKVILHMVPPGDFHGGLEDVGAAAEAPGDAVSYWAKHEKLAANGVDGWWPDEGDLLSVYARLARNRMYWEGGRHYAPAKRPFALHRNGYAGLQRYGWLWSGDTFSTWKALTAQIMVGIGVGLSGIPFWGTDTGGFVPTLEYTPELFVRWFQFSAFCPSFRSHGRTPKLHQPWGWNLGTADPKEVTGDWVKNWPPEADLHRADIEGICRKYLDLRYQLMPYLYSTAAEAHGTGMPVIRALWLTYPADERLALVDDVYLWGDSLLVAPVHEKGATTRAIPLPAGGWWNYWTNERLDGAKTVTVAAGLDVLPLFVKAGGMVLTGPVKQWTGEVNDEPVTLHVYPGADGRFTWYDDDGDGFAYESGKYMRVECAWDDGARMLTLLREKAGELGEGRKVRVVLVGTSKVQELTLGAGVKRVKL